MLQASVRVCVWGWGGARAHATQGTPTSADRTKAEATGGATIQTWEKTAGSTFPARISDIPSAFTDNYPLRGARTRPASSPDRARPTAGKSAAVCVFAGNVLFLAFRTGETSPESLPRLGVGRVVFDA